MAKVLRRFFHVETNKKYYPQDSFKGSDSEIKRLTGLGYLEKPKSTSKKKSK